ncbi:MAG: TRAP transporter small permease subunit [Pseudomonadota bacterium]
MALLLGLLWPLQRLNQALLSAGRWFAIICLAVMVMAILIQIFYRYVLGNALPWPDEAARFFMLWMTGLIAPLGYRHGGFVAIDMAVRMLSTRVAAFVTLVLLSIAMMVLIRAAQIGWAEVTGFGGRFATASLYVPTSLTFETWLRVPRSWMMGSILVGFLLLNLVNIELMLRSLITLLGGKRRLEPLPGEGVGAD